MSETTGFRTEHDLLGNKEVPTAAYYGVQTARALENFHITGVPISHYPDLIRALAMVKLAAEALRTGKGVVQLLREKKLLTDEQIAEVMDPASMTGQTRVE